MCYLPRIVRSDDILLNFGFSIKNDLIFVSLQEQNLFANVGNRECDHCISAIRLATTAFTLHNLVVYTGALIDIR